MCRIAIAIVFYSSCLAWAQSPGVTKAVLGPNDPEQELRNARNNLLIDVLNRNLSDRTYFALASAKQLDLSEEQFNKIEAIGRVQPTKMMTDIGFASATDFYMTGDDTAFQSRLGKIEKEMQSEEKRQVSGVDRILDKAQRQAIRKLYFDANLMTEPTRALLAADVQPSEKLQKRFKSLASKRGVSLAQRRKNILNLIDETPFARKVSQLMKQKLEIPDHDERTEVARPRISGLSFFGAHHDRLLYLPQASETVKCKFCDESFDAESTGYRLGRQHFHEDCFIELVTRASKKNGDRTKTDNPRRK